MDHVRCIGAALCAVGLSACDTPSTFGLRDAGIEAGFLDVPVDTGPEAGWPADEGTCATPVNLDQLGTASGSHVLTIQGNNDGAALAPMASLVTPSSCNNSSQGTYTPNEFEYQVVFAHTMATSAVLEANTALPGSDTALDTVVYITDGCSTTANVLGCNDDASSLDGGTAGDSRSTATTLAPVAAGTTVFIVVAGYPHAATDPYRSQGTFTLQVTEIP